MIRRLALAALLMLLAASPAAAQTPAELSTSIGNLGALDFTVRMNAARLVRRAPEAQAVPALTDAVRGHSDQFVRYRALVLLTAFGDKPTADLVRELLKDKNDRLREVAYKWLEQHPDPRLTPALIAALQTEGNEFVRPALVGALASVGDDPQAQRALVGEVPRGADFFRTAVIDALGRHRAAYAVDALAGVAQLEGALRDEAVLALGRIGGPRAGAALAEVREAGAVALRVRAARCLMGEACDEHVKALTDAATANARGEIVETAVVALGAVAESGNAAAMSALIGLAARGASLRDQVSVAIGGAAARRPDRFLAWLSASPETARATAIDLLKEGFDQLEEDFAEEQFFAAARAAYWKADDGSPGRSLTATLIQRLEF